MKLISLCAFLQQLVDQRFLKAENLDALLRETDMNRLLDRLDAHHASTAEKWAGRDVV